MNPPEWWSAFWWRWFLTIVLASVIAGLVTGAVFLWLNLRAAARARQSAERERRISDVTDEYMRLVTATPLKYQGVMALLVAGVKRLKSHWEIAEALRRMTERGGQQPLGRPTDSVSDLLGMFREVTFDGANVRGFEAALAKYKKQT